ncbi:MAG: MFS transporter, partial [Chloroflexi bacterium]|nr:MFS transporter [Chloroflexota bacterium]
TPALWLIIASLGVATFGITSVGVHQVAYLTDRGIAPAVAAAVLSIYTLSSATANLMWGVITEYLDERALNVGALTLAAGAIWFLTTVDTTAAAFGFAACFGLFARGESALINILLAHYYGRQNFGAITGFTRPFQAGAGAVGPVVAGMTFDMTGRYIGAFSVLIGMFLTAALLMFLARKPALPNHAAASPA